MTHLERFMNTVERKEVDRPACWLGMPDKEALPGLFAFFNVASEDELRLALDDDIYPVELPYHSPVSNAIYAAFDFTGQGSTNAEERTLTTAGCFEDCEDIAEVDAFDWPNPSLYISPEECLACAEKAPADRAVMGILWSAHFQDTCAAFGMEAAMMKMLTDPDVYKAVDAKIVDFYLQANKIFYEATRGKIHAVLIGNDLGSQCGLMLSPQMVREFVLPGSRKLIQQAKEYGLTVMYHSCGSIAEIIPDLIEAGVDVIHPIQALATGMSPESLKQKYGDKVAFCGGVDAQNLMVNQSPEDVREAVTMLRRIFPTGLVISPSHEAILQDTKPGNIKALFEAVHEG